MQIIGKWLKRVDTDEGRAEFKKFYDVDFYEYMINHEVTHITRLFPQNIKYIVFLDSYSIYQIFALEEKDHLMVYSSGCIAKEKRIFNTDGMAFMRLVRDGEIKGTFCIENSPFDQEKNDWEEDLGFTHKAGIDKVNTMLNDKGLPMESTKKNTLFVRQL